MFHDLFSDDIDIANSDIQDTEVFHDDIDDHDVLDYNHDTFDDSFSLDDSIHSVFGDDGDHFSAHDEEHNIGIHDENHLGDFSTRPNIFGGRDIYDGGSMVAQSQPNIFGGENMHFFANAEDGQDDVSHDALVNNDLFGGSDNDLLNHADTSYNLVDVDGDGVPDLVITHVDSDGDGYYDKTITYHIDDDGLHYESLTGDGYTYAFNLDDIDTFDPQYSDDATVVGHPAEAMKHWEDQGHTNKCGLYSQKFVIEEITGEHIDIDTMQEIAESHGWFSEEGGTTSSNMNKMLDYFGIPNEMSWNNNLSDLHNVLSSGGRAIVAIDADEIWHGEEDGVFSPLDSANHVVEVAGIDYSDPDHPMVILNDSGNATSGCGEMIPADKFMDAWADSDFQMVAV